MTAAAFYGADHAIRTKVIVIGEFHIWASHTERTTEATESVESIETKKKRKKERKKEKRKEEEDKVRP